MALLLFWSEFPLAGLSQTKPVAKAKRFSDSSYHKKSLEIEALSLKYSAK
jgi:hypothetical protein